MPRRSRSLVCSVLFAALLTPGAAFAGTTGTLSGVAQDETTHKPLAGVKVTAASPSQTATVTTDAAGHYTFLALAPDTYTVTAEETGFDAVQVQGVTIAADNVRTLALETRKTLKTIATVSSRAPSSLVRPGTTSDVYSVNATQQQAVQGVGGGAGLNTAYSAIATVPGAFVPQGAQGGNGIGSNVYIRGGDYDQVGFEIDGVPVNRAFDNYPSGPAASLGQQELQVYTGAAPANAEGQGLSGFINQVIKTGTYPNYQNVDASIGGPAFYHKGGIEFGGSNRNRTFTYYLGADLYNQEFKYGDQFDGASLTQNFGVPLAPCPGLLDAKGNPTGSTPATTPSCFQPRTGADYTANVYSPAGYSALALSPYVAFAPAMIKTRDDVANLHFAIPHKDGTRDDVQFLADENAVSTQFFDSDFDQGGVGFQNASGLGVPAYANGYQYAGKIGTALPSNYGALTSTYYYPTLQSNPTNGVTPASTIPLDLRDATSNEQGILKLQYTKTLGQNALLKLYGYSFYSDWLMVGPQSAYADFQGPVSPDYELSSHTRGVSGTFNDQLNAQNLLQLQGSYTTSNALRDNNTQMFNGSSTLGARSQLALLVDSSNPTNGICYTDTGVATTCSYAAAKTSVAPGSATLAAAASGSITQPTATTCGGGNCELYTVGNGQYATYNRVTPKVFSASLTDDIRPNAKLDVNVGLRLDNFQYEGQDTQSSPARTLFYNAFNLDNCLDSGLNLVDKVIPTSSGGLGLASPNAPCPTGYTAANFTNPAGRVTESYTRFQPRFGATYALNPTTVVRASYGRFTQAPNSAYEQYNALQEDAPALLYGTYGFQKFGFTSPDHFVQPQDSSNYDFSIEKSFGDTAIKLSPFIRKTQNQIQQFYLNQQTNFVSGLNVGNQTSQGFEFELDKGNFARDGLAAKLAFTYTNSYIRYNALSNGSTIIDPLNAAIKQYNGYTSFCGSHPSDKACGPTTSGQPAAPCYTPVAADGTGGIAVPNAAACTAADIANPYFNAPLQGLLGTNQDYATYDIFPAGIGTSATGYGAPYFATFVLQYKHDKFSVTPNLQFQAGQRYGAPLTTYGIAPDACGASLGAGGNPAADGRYTYGAAGGGAYDASTCGGGGLAGGIPDQFTGRFDDIGQFAAPSQIQFGTQFQYDFDRHVTGILTLANIVNTCFGGQTPGFTVRGACNYGVINAGGTTGAVGNFYNPGAAIQPILQSPYEPQFAGYPFSIYGQIKLKI